MKYYITKEGLDYIEEVKSSKQHGQDIENREFDKGVYGFHSDLTGTIKGGQAKILRRKRLAKTRLHRWAKAISRATDPFSDVGTGSSKVRGKVREAKRKKKGDDRDEEGGRGEEGDEALEGLAYQKRIKFLQRKSK